ncbi:MAG: RNHCP domain-containing protein [Candidatus Micrarchaeota archaeon]|nr:RNHCP domain-containing protein [Candidatus Micrarchaeota archaeon]
MEDEAEERQELGRRNFRRVIEDFVCEHCGHPVKGSGYTDHCPRCLWGKHVDIKPGDRASDCRGALRPISASYAKGSYTIVYRCERCGIVKRFKAAADDDADILLAMCASGAPES